MERKSFIKRLSYLTIAPTLVLAACSEDPNKKELKSGTTSKQVFTCPMHPQIIKNEMSTCPICGMDLVPYVKDSNEKMLKIDEKRQVLANISTMTLSTAALAGATVLNGKLFVNPESTAYITARISGRIERLLIQETGVQVHKGQLLYQLYSEELATLQQEYLQAEAQSALFPDDRIEQQLVEAAKQKLRLYGQSTEQIRALQQSKRQAPTVDYVAPSGGIIAELSIVQGQYVSEGSPIMRLESYDHLWVQADVYPSELTRIKQGDQVEVQITGWENEGQPMKIDFISPAYLPGTQITQIRGTIRNLSNQWQPGLHTAVILPNKSASEVLNLPVHAVIRDAKGTHVWIRKAKDTFEPRLVQLGYENDTRVEIKGGLSAGEDIVVTGTYLLFSEYVLKKGKHPIDVLKG